MKDLQTKERFVELRAQGRSFGSIAKELNVSKTTLITWSRDLEREINNAQYFEFQRLLEQYKMTKVERANVLMRELQRVNDAIGQKDVNAMSIKELLMLNQRIENQLSDLLKKAEYRTGEQIVFDVTELLGTTAGEEITIKLE